MLKEVRTTFEALSAGNDQLQHLDTMQRDIYTVSHVRKCGHCGMSHTPRQCPAYKDTCRAYSSIGHWKACCRKTRTQRRPRNSSGKRQERIPSDNVGHGRPTYRRSSSSHRKNNRVHSVDTEYETDGESYQNRSTPSLSELNVLTPLTAGTQRGMKHSRCAMYNHPDSKETDILFG